MCDISYSRPRIHETTSAGSPRYLEPPSDFALEDEDDEDFESDDFDSDDLLSVDLDSPELADELSEAAFFLYESLR